MKRNRTIMILFFTTIILLCGCLSVYHFRPTAVALTRYVQIFIPKIAQLENVAFEAYNSAVGRQYKSDHFLITTINKKILPCNNSIKAYVTNFHSEDTLTSYLNGAYDAIVDTRVEAFEIIEDGLRKQDVKLLQLGYAQLEQSVENFKKWRTVLFRACRLYGVKIEF